MNVDEDKELTGRIIGAAIDVHRELGPGNDAVVYEEALSLLLTELGVAHECQKAMRVRYRGTLLDCGLRLDVLVENRLPVELKSVERSLPVHEAQLLTYMRMGGYPLGLLINFDVARLKEGIQRKVLTRSKRSGEQERTETPKYLEELSTSILDSALAVHRELGPGLLNCIYEECLCHELSLSGISFGRDVVCDLRFGSQQLENPGQIDLLVNEQVPVICLSVKELTPRHEAILRHRLKQGGFCCGFLFNFNAPLLTQGLRRISLTAEIGRTRR